MLLLKILFIGVLGIAAMMTITAAIHAIAPYAGVLVVLIVVYWIIKKYDPGEPEDQNETSAK